MAQDIPRYIREMFDKAQAEIGAYVGGLELEPFARGVEDGQMGRKEPGNMGVSYEAGYTAGRHLTSQEEEKKQQGEEHAWNTSGEGRPMKFGFFQQRPSRQH